MNPPEVGGARAFNELYADAASSEDAPGAEPPAPSASAPTGSAAPFKRKAKEEGGTGKEEKVQKMGSRCPPAHPIGPERPAGAEGPPPNLDPSSSTSSSVGRTVYVGSLPPSVTERPLRQYFSSFGEVSEVKVIRDRGTGISRGFAFVTFVCGAAAAAALAQKAPHVIEGRPAKVASAEKKGQQEQAGGGGGGGGGEGKAKAK